MIKVEKDDVERAVEATHRAIGRLVALLGHEDAFTVRKASLALLELGGEAVVGLLAAALPRAKSPRHRLAIAGTLYQLGEEMMPQVAAALADAYRRERDPQVAAAIGAALMRIAASDLVSALRPVGRS
jgi:HEAT repeat protein